MDKQTVYLKLINDVNQCHLCEQMCTLSHSECSEYLVNDNHGLNTGMPYVNLWNLWHGNLDADIMVIGQDFGQCENATEFLEKQKSKYYTNPTDTALRDLFKASFDIDVDDENASLFFTNMANCYRKHQTTGSMHPGWLPICAYKYMARLIRIIQPKIIIVLGKAAFDAIFCLDGLSVECTNKKSNVNDTLADVMKYDYQLKIDDNIVRVFPVYHPGANSKRNRTTEQQIQDWKRIAEYYRGIKNDK